MASMEFSHERQVRIAKGQCPFCGGDRIDVYDDDRYAAASLVEEIVCDSFEAAYSVEWALVPAALRMDDPSA